MYRINCIQDFYLAISYQLIGLSFKSRSSAVQMIKVINKI